MSVRIGVCVSHMPIDKMKFQELDMTKRAKSEAEEQKDQPIDSELQNIIEAALFASKKPLGIRKIMALFPDDAQPSKIDIQNVILNLEEQCEHRGIELRRIGNGWRFQSKEKYATWMRKIGANKPPRYSRALLETLSIIAYRQPVTRGDIEEVRGVGVSSDTIRTLEERDWISQIGHRDVPGRPALFGTTQEFLEYFNMTSLRELPELMDKRDLGEIAKDMNLTLPMDGVLDENDADQSPAEEGAEVIELHPEENGSQLSVDDVGDEANEASSDEANELSSAQAVSEKADEVPPSDD